MGEGDLELSKCAPGPLAQAILAAARAAKVGICVTYVDRGKPEHAYVNQALAEITGYTVEELMAQTPGEHVPEEELTKLRARFAKRSGGEAGEISYDSALVRKGGKRVPINVATTHLDVGGRRAIVAFIRDITLASEAQEEARRLEARFRKVIEAAPDAIAISRDGKVLYANAALVRLHGYDTVEEYLAKPLSDHLGADEYAVLRHRQAIATATGQRLGPRIYRGVRRDGQPVLMEVTSIMFDYEGSPAVLSFARDVSERMRMEAQLVQADRLAALGTLAAGVAHEVNNPLAYLLLNLEWIARQLPQVTENPARVPELAAMLAEARHGAERVAEIVRELRAFSRVDGEKRSYVDLETTARAAIRMALHEIRPRARVLTSFEPVDPVYANEARIEQVLLNLLLNAAQALREDRTDGNEIVVSVRPGNGRTAVIEVSDNGVGIPQETLSRIFDPFFTTKPVGVGTGLGLSICHSIVTSAGGTITAHSSVGEGTTFRIVLPTRSLAEEAVSATTPVPSEVRSVRRARVLVIDDEVCIANTLRDLLQAEHDVTALSSAAAALAAMRGGATFDVVFCDLMMPELSGMDLYERLRETLPGAEQRLVFMTGGAFTPRAAEFLAKVRNARLEKPFSLTAVEEIVRATLRPPAPRIVADAG